MAPLVKGQLLGFGSLTHSHLQQILKNTNCELLLGVEEICDRDGMVSLALLEKHDPMFALYARQGLMWSVLSSAINDDPEALDVIQAAANCKNSMAMVPHEMECIAKVSALCSKSSAVAELMCFETVRDQLAATLKGMAYDPDFQHLFAFVVNLGGDKGPFLKDLRFFAAKMINPKAAFTSLLFRLASRCFSEFACPCFIHFFGWGV
jgi:hypothetical protein